MSRDDLLNTNAGIVGSVTEEIVRQSPNAILIIVSNPLDAMSQWRSALRLSKTARDRMAVFWIQARMPPPSSRGSRCFG
jgi:malate/lactate dehydrogenase